MDTNDQIPEQNENTTDSIPSLLQLIDKDKTQNTDSQHKKSKRKRSLILTLVRIVVSVVIIAIGIYIILWLVARAAKYVSIEAMLQHMWVELQLMWQRILY